MVTDYRRLVGLHLDDELVNGHDAVLQQESGHVAVIRYWFRRQRQTISHVLLR